jgi:CRISPR-associated endonuclease/helicase Cas3
MSHLQSDESKPLASDSPLYRILEIRDFLASVPEPVTRNALARQFNVSRHTIYRDLLKVEQITPISETLDGRIYIDRRHYAVNVRFTIHEAMAIYLAARLLARRMDRRNRHAASALRKLAHALENFAPEISRQMELSADMVDSDEQQLDQTYLAVLETLTQALADRRWVNLWYHKDKNGEQKVYRLATYFIEPYAIGQTTYVVGLLENTSRLYTFKIERIAKVELQGESYTIPADFNITAYLADAWGIWTSSAEPVQVALRFSREVAYRVKETRWHHLQEVEEQADGSLIWRVRIANLTEMLPWIQGWGPQVEVLEPLPLREQMLDQARRTVDLYCKNAPNGD